MNHTADKFGYNGIEQEQSLALNLYEMELRQYDPAIARWTGIDPVVHHSYSTYNAFDNNPIFWADPSGADATSDLINDAWNNTGANGNEIFLNNGNGEFFGTNGSTVSSGGCDDCNKCPETCTQKKGSAAPIIDPKFRPLRPIPGGGQSPKPAPTVGPLAVASLGLLAVSDTPLSKEEEFYKYGASGGEYFWEKYANAINLAKIKWRDNSSGYYIHYTTIENAALIFTSGTLRANPSGKVYLTNALLTPLEAFTILFQAQETHKGRGDGAVIIKLHTFQEASLGSGGGDIFEQYHFGNLTPQEIIYAGPNPFGG